MKRMVWLMIVGWGWWLSGTVSGEESDAVRLRLHLPAGHSAMVQKVVANVGCTASLGEDGSTGVWPNKAILDTEIVCRAVDPNGVMEIWETCKRTRVWIGDGEESLHHDSAASGKGDFGEAAPYVGLFRPTIVKHVRPDGAVVKMAGMEKAIDDLLKLKEVIDEDLLISKEAFLQRLRDPAEAHVAGALWYYPSEMVSEGDSWDFFPANGAVVNTLTVTSIKERAGVVRIESGDRLKAVEIDDEVAKDDPSICVFASTKYVELATGLVLFGEESIRVFDDDESVSPSSTTTIVTRLLDESGTRSD